MDPKMSKFYNTLLFNLRAKYGRGGQLAKGSPKTRPAGFVVLVATYKGPGGEIGDQAKFVR